MKARSLLSILAVICASNARSDAAPSSAELPDLGAAPTQKSNLAVRPGPGGVTLESTFENQKIIVAPEYSNETGASLGATFATLLGQDAAVGVLLNIGNDKKEWLINAGYKLDERQRIVVTAGQLKQFLDYTFISGSEKVGLTQNSGAVSYQFQLGKEFLRFFEVNGYLSKTAGRDLTDKTFAVDTATLFELWHDPRRIAGGKVTGLQGKLGFSPNQNSVIKVSLGQERLSYDLLAGTDSVNRLTSGVEWAQQLGSGYQLKAAAHSFASQNRYTLGIDRSLAGSDGRHNLGVSLIGLRGRDGVGDDNQFKLSYTYVFGAGASSGRGAAMGMSPRANAAPDPITPWSGSALLDQVAQRPSFIPSHVVAKIDNTALPTRLIAVDKTALPAGSTISAATGDITTPLGVVVTTIAGVTKNLGAFANTGQFSLSGNSLVTKPSLIVQPALGVVDSYVVTVNNFGGGTTLVTVLVSHGSVKIDSITIAAAAALPAGYVSQGGLTWMPVSHSDTWGNANTYCTTTTINGQMGWRLPTTVELSALFTSGAMNGQGWILGGTWSSIPGGGAFIHQSVNLIDGSANWFGDAGNGRVTCVR